MRKVARDLSDHYLLLLDFAIGWVAKDKNPFRFDVAWFKNEDFLTLVSNIWEKLVYTNNPIGILNIKWKRFKK
jgi:hypothetical protein